MQTLVDLLSEIQKLGDREAVRSSNGLRTWVATYRDVYGKIGAIVQHLDERGIRKSDRVMVWAENRMEWVALFWACIARGVEVVPVDFRFSPELVARIRAESKPKAIFDSTQLDTIAGWQPVYSFTP